MLKLSIICGLLASIIWRTTPTMCRQHAGTPTTAPPHFSSSSHNVNQIMAVNIQSYMDITARPCENFYQYACGNWYQQHIDQMDYGDTLGLLDYEVNRKLEHLLRKIGGSGGVNTANGSSNALSNDSNISATSIIPTTTPMPPTTPSPTQPTSTVAQQFEQNAEDTEEEFSADIYRKFRTYYRSCKKVKPYNLKKYLQLVQPDYVSSWVVLTRNGGKNWNADKFDWLAAIAKLRLYGLNGVLLKEEVLPRWDESSSNSIYLDKPNLAETQPMSEGVMIELLLDIGLTKRVANEIAREVDIFEQQLHKLHTIEDDEGPKEMQLGYLEEYMTEVPWLHYLSQLKGPATNLETTVIIQNIPYMRALVKLLATVRKETICNYIMLKFLIHLKQQGPAEISKQECIASLRRAMPLALSYIVGKHIYKDSQHNDENVQDIFAHLKQKFYEVVSDNRLQLELPIVDVLLQKINNMQLQIGNSPRNTTAAYFDAYYERVELDSNNFYVNQLSLLRLNVEKSHESLDLIAMNDNNDDNINSTNNDTFFDSDTEILVANSTTATTTNSSTTTTYIMTDSLGSSSSPFYVKPKNLIVVPFGFLQMPVYQRHLRNIFKYAVLGFSIAHELLHGFDSSGIDYDSIGNIMGPSEEIAANQRFIQGLRCMQNELATGSRSLNEKLADYEGLRLAYETYFNGNVSHESRVATLPQFTPKQLFFISFAQFFCGKVNPNVGQTAYLEHAQDELRVLQSLANFDEFSKAFQCERRAKMHSQNRCRLWL